jgi:hypothetical protein
LQALAHRNAHLAPFPGPNGPHSPREGAPSGWPSIILSMIRCPAARRVRIAAEGSARLLPVRNLQGPASRRLRIYRLRLPDLARLRHQEQAEHEANRSRINIGFARAIFDMRQSFEFCINSRAVMRQHSEGTMHKRAAILRSRQHRPANRRETAPGAAPDRRAGRMAV